jgi:hypothetical protein
MMTWMRRTSRYFLAVVVLAFIASLAYWGHQDRSNITAVATVNGEEISAVTYDRAYRATVEQYRQILRDRFNDKLMRSLRLPDR